MSVVLGVDIGGSHITAAQVDLESRTLVAGSGKRKLVNAQASAEEIINDWCEVIDVAFKNLPLNERKIGIAMPGPFNYEEGISLIEDQDKFQLLYKKNIKNILAQKLGITPNNIRFMNDAACFLQGEVFCGAAKNYNRVLGVTLGTGLGSAFCEAGLAKDADLWKSPFKEGIAEDYFSTRWFVKKYFELSGISVSGVKELIHDASPFVAQVFLEFTDNLCMFLLPQIKKHHAEAVVFGGNISNAHAYFLPALQNALTATPTNVALKQALLNEDASLIGAASCWRLAEAQQKEMHKHLS